MSDEYETISDLVFKSENHFLRNLPKRILLHRIVVERAQGRGIIKEDDTIRFKYNNVDATYHIERYDEELNAYVISFESAKLPIFRLEVTL